MPLESSDLVQKSVLWPRSKASADTFGNPRIEARVEINCKWQLKVTLGGSSHSLGLAVVGTVWVDRVIAVGSILRRAADSDLYEVVSYNEIPDINCSDFRRSVMVSLWNGVLPEGV